MLNIIPTYILLLLASVTCAQTPITYNVSGIIISANSKEPISSGTISIANNSGVKCDSNGRFTIYNLPKGQHKIIFSALGYETKDTIVSIVDHNVNGFAWVISTECNKYNSELAVKHLHNGQPLLLLQSGIAPIVYPTDNVFEKKYGVIIYDFGCVAGDKVDCLVAYNKTIFSYLDKKFGNNWRAEVRSDIIGLKSK